MIRLSKKVEYALIALLHMSEKRASELTTTRELSQEYQIPQELMGKILQRLAKQRIIRSVQGIKGGYSLEKPLEAVNLNQIAQVVDGPLQVVTCISLKGKSTCTQTGDYRIKNPMEVIQQKLNNFFNGITLKDLRNELNYESESLEL